MQEAPTPADHTTAATVLEGRYARFLENVLNHPRSGDFNDEVDDLSAAMWDRDDYALLTNDDDFTPGVRAALVEYMEAAWDYRDAFFR